MWIVVGLGNPGKQYSATRHNVGFMLIQRLADKLNVRLKKRKYSAKAAQVELEHNPVLLVKPWTYMNKSGLAVKKLLECTGRRLNRILVVYDDLDIPLGEIRIRKSGGPGTHNGMASIVQEIDSTEFPRIRIGIGPLPPGVDATDFVLADFRSGFSICCPKRIAARFFGRPSIAPGGCSPVVQAADARCTSTI